MPPLPGLPGALIASVALALAALAARLVVWLPPRHLRAWLPWLQSLTVGLLLGDALLHMLPEAIEHGIGARPAAACVALGVFLLVLVECLIRQPAGRAGTAAFARMDVLADAIHHLVDGVVIGATFTIDAGLGAVVTLAICAHELPREASNAGVLVAGGYPPRRAFMLSLATTAAIPLGAAGIILAGRTEPIIATQLALATGTTLYLALADLLPPLWPILDRRSRFAPALGVACGLAFMALATSFAHHAG